MAHNLPSKPHARLHLRQLLRLLVQRVHHFAHAVYGLQGRLVRFVDGRLLENDQHTFALVEDAAQLLVEDHLRQFLLDQRHVQLDGLRDVQHLGGKGRAEDRY